MRMRWSGMRSPSPSGFGALTTLIVIGAGRWIYGTAMGSPAARSMPR